MNHEDIDNYRRDLGQDAFFCMEWSKQSYNDIMLMPVKRFKDYLKWKKDYEDEKQRLINIQINKGK